jgi:hypothetical protein
MEINYKLYADPSSPLSGIIADIAKHNIDVNQLTAEEIAELVELAADMQSWKHPATKANYHEKQKHRALTAINAMNLSQLKQKLSEVDLLLTKYNRPVSEYDNDFQQILYVLYGRIAELTKKKR